MTSQQQIDQFKEISGKMFFYNFLIFNLGCTDSNEAANFLESCNGNLEQAINLFFSQQSRKKQNFFNNSSQLSSKQKNSNQKTFEKE